MESPKPIRRTPPKNLGLLELIRAKREWDWKPSVAELKKGFRGWHQRGFLPHFDAPDVTQFVTFQLHDSFPVTRRAEFEAILKEPDDSAKRKQLEAWLDRGHGECWLRRQGVAEIVEKILLEADGRDYRMQAWVVMPNHVHLVVDVWEVPLAKLINSWKGKSSRLANVLLKRSGKFWQEDYYDTLIRDEAHLKRAIRYTEQKATTLLPILKERIVPDSIVYSDSLPSYNALDVSGFRHLRINHSKLFAAGKNHINGIENFWNQAKRHLRKFNGVPKAHFPLFLKECEWRFNNPNPQTQLTQLNQRVHQLLT